jgi:hypothetical protein
VIELIWILASYNTIIIPTQYIIIDCTITIVLISVLIIDQEHWNVRQAILTGKRDLLIRWMVKMLEDSTKKVREYQSQGKNVTRWTMLNTLENFNLIETGCLRCLGVYTSFVNNYEMHYPHMMDQLILINSKQASSLYSKFIIIHN